MTRPIIPYNYDDVPTMEKTEYCTTAYDISMCRVINVTTKYNVVPSRRDFEQVIKVLHGENQMRFEIELMSNPKYRRG